MQLFLIVATDGDNQIIPLAAQIAKSETAEAWGTFLQGCASCMPFPNTSEMNILSDRSKGIDAAVTRVCSQAQHVYCTVHLVRNVMAHIRSAADGALLKDLINHAADAPLKADFEHLMCEIRRVNDAAFRYLAAIKPELWAQSHSKIPRFFVVTSNAVESLNAVLVNARKQGPVKVLVALYDWIFKTFGVRRAQSMELQQQFTNRAWTTLQEAAQAGRLCSKVIINGVEAQVYEKNRTFAVRLNDVSYSCGQLDMLGLPCRHISERLLRLGLLKSRINTL